MLSYKAMKDTQKDYRLLLDNIRSVHNVGSIFRTAETIGISKIYCLGTTPTPLDRFQNKRKDFAKVALGAEDLVSWEYLEDAKDLIQELFQELKRQGFQIIALEQSSDSVDYKKVELGDKTLIVVGNEVGGVSKELLKLVDKIIEIPMKGKKESLNVSVATGVALFRLLDK